MPGLGWRAHRRNEFRPPGWGLGCCCADLSGEAATADIRVEVCADPGDGGSAEVIPLSANGPVPATTGGHFYRGTIAGARPDRDYRVCAARSYRGVRVPTETPLSRWQRRWEVLRHGAAAREDLTTGAA